MTFQVSAPARVNRITPVTVDPMQSRIEDLLAERAEVLKKKPNLESNPWARFPAGLGLSVVAMAPPVMGAMYLVEHSNWYKKLPAYSMPEFKAMGIAMAVALPFMAVGFIGGLTLADKFFGPKGDKRESIITEHEKSVKREVNLIDRQIAALRS